MAGLRLPTLSAVLLCSVVLLGCADDAASSGSGDPLPSVRIAGDERTVDVLVSEHCADGVCGQVSLAGPTPDLGASGPLAVRLPAEGWSLEASMTEDGRECPRSFAAPVQARSGGRYTLSPVGPPGRYLVTVRASGPGESLVASFLWTTTSQGPPPEPSARVTVLVDDGSGPVRTPAVELVLSNLSASPERAEAKVTARSPEGADVALPVARVAECTGFGVVWHGTADHAPDAEDLGSQPYTYDVEVVLDGVRHTASATWPHDQTTATDWSLPLVFDPPLPGAG